jgi:hypothetical protein
MTVKVARWELVADAVGDCVAGSVVDTAEDCATGTVADVVAEAVAQALKPRAATTNKIRLVWLVFISHLLIKN